MASLNTCVRTAMDRGEIISRVARRRRWTSEQKLKILTEALEPGASRVTIELEFVGVGLMGVAMAPIVGWRGRQEMPGNMANLKRLLEGDHDSLSGGT